MATIYAIPGFGCTGLLFKNIHVPGHRIKVLKWPTPQKNYSLQDYAKQFIPQITTSEPFYLMGVSFGGMICAELGEILSPEKVILISSAKNNTEIPLHLRLMKRVSLHHILSEKWIKRMAVLSRGIIGFTKDMAPLFIEMMNAMPPEFFRYCMDYILKWDRKANTIPLIHIHGKADLLLPYSNIKKPDYTIDKGNHAAIVNNAAEINAILQKIIV